LRLTLLRFFINLKPATHSASKNEQEHILFSG